MRTWIFKRESVDCRNYALNGVFLANRISCLLDKCRGNVNVRLITVQNTSHSEAIRTKPIEHCSLVFCCEAVCFLCASMNSLGVANSAKSNS